MNRIVGTLAALGVAAILAWWAYDSLEWVPSTRDIPEAPEVRQDRWMAFSRGTVEGLIQRYQTVDEIDLSEASLVVISEWDLEDADPDEWMDWVAAGGRLILEVSGYEFDLLGETWWNRPPLQDLDPELSEEEGEGQAETAGSPFRPTIDRTVDFPRAVESDDTLLYRDGELTPMVIRHWGSGWILVSGTPYFLHNQSLRREDNRRFAAALVDGLGFESGTLWLPAPYVSPAPDSPIDWTPVLVAMVVLAVLIYWRAWPRLGPEIPEGSGDRFSLKERFLAEGRFFWREKARSVLLAPLKGADHPVRLEARTLISEVGRWVEQHNNRKKKETP